MFWFGRLFEIFEQIDTGHDRRMDFQEFQNQALPKLGLKLTPQQAQDEWKKIDERCCLIIILGSS